MTRQRPILFVALLSACAAEGDLEVDPEVAGTPTSEATPAPAPELPVASGTTQWSVTAGDTDWDLATAIGADGQGNLYTAGYFAGTVDLGCGDMTAAGYYDLFLVKHDPTGDCLWSRQAGDAESIAFANAISVSADGTVDVVGTYSATATFGAITIGSYGGYDSFLVRYSSAGAPQWARTFGGEADDYAYGVATGDSIWVTGAFGGTAHFDIGDVTSNGAWDVFVARFSSSGLNSLVESYGGPGDDVGNAIAVSGSTVAVTGAFRDRAIFGGADLDTAGIYDAFLALFDADSGMHLGSGRFGGAGFDSGTAIRFDSQGRIVLAGYFQGTANLGGDDLVGSGEWTGFVARYSAGGLHQWSHAIDTDGACIVTGLAVDADDDVSVAGTFSGSTATGASDLLVAKYLENGESAWTRTFGAADGYAGASAVAATADSVVAAGYFDGAIDLGAGTQTSAGSYDVALVAVTR